MIGQIIGNYRITEKIGEGGMGEVFKGVDLMLEREVAIKMLRPELTQQSQVVERFRQEAVTLAKLNHQHIATLHAFLRQENNFFMVMEFVRGRTLDEVVRGQGALATPQAALLISQTLAGLEHAHKSGVIHRDIKPSNLMLTEDGLLKIMDFGIARALWSTKLTRTGRIIGTIEYMAPEQIRGQDADTRSDLYSAGIVLYELLTGRVPFQSESEFDLMRGQVEEPPPPPRSLAANLTEDVERLVLRALAKEPDERFQNAAEFRAALASHTAESDSLKELIGRLQVSQQHGEARHVTPGSATAGLSADAAATQPLSPSVAKTQEAQASGVAVGAPRFALSRINWKHYVTAAAVLILLIAVVATRARRQRSVPQAIAVASPTAAPPDLHAKAAPSPESVPTPSPTPDEVEAGLIEDLFKGASGKGEPKKSKRKSRKSDLEDALAPVRRE